VTAPKDLFGFGCDFVAGAASPEQIPRNFSVPELAFAGRSNVGKSSLINAVVKKRNCARVSKSPGCTRQINFFCLQNRISLADLPGYGYASVSREVRKSWDELIINYIQKRQNLKRIFLLIDSRRGIMEDDEKFMALLDDLAIVYQIVVTKIDKTVSPAELIKSIESKILTHPAAFPTIISTSSKKNVGIRDLQKEIVSFYGDVASKIFSKN
jgi:GTP-binding protein